MMTKTGRNKSREYIGRRRLFAVYHFERIRKFACRAPRSRRKYRDRGTGRRVARRTAGSHDVGGKPVVIYHANVSFYCRDA